MLLPFAVDRVTAPGEDPAARRSRFTMPPPLCASRALAGAALLALLGAAGCAVGGSFDSRITTAEGDVVDVPLTLKPVDISDGTVRVNFFEYVPAVLTDGTNRLRIRCAADISGGVRPSEVLVRDVTDAPIITLFDDRAPALLGGKRWTAQTAPLGPSDDIIRWLADIETSIRIYRFTFTFADGSVRVLTVPVIIPAALKEAMRKKISG